MKDYANYFTVAMEFFEYAFTPEEDKQRNEALKQNNA
jgi:hypothetical protein